VHLLSYRPRQQMILVPLLVVSVWAYPWIEEKEEPKARVKDPAYGQNFSFHVYRIDAPNKTVRFAAGEFSNAYWGFYVAKNGA
jgi:hypothetical protein